MHRKAILLAGVSLAAAAVAVLWFDCGGHSGADPTNAVLVERGREIYAGHCASCHGAQLEGQANWQQALPNGRLPAPPHDPSGHTFHHPDEVLFRMVKVGKSAGDETDMPIFGGVLSDDEIWAVLAFIKSTWPEAVQKHQPKLTSEQKAALDALSKQSPAR
jgi:mono/diheme cytochrome c family protein